MANQYSTFIKVNVKEIILEYEVTFTSNVHIEKSNILCFEELKPLEVSKGPEATNYIVNYQIILGRSYGRTKFNMSPLVSPPSGYIKPTIYWACITGQALCYVLFHR